MNKFVQFKKNVHIIIVVFVCTMVVMLPTQSVMAKPFDIAQIIKQKTVTLDVKNTPLREILVLIKNQTGVGFVFNGSVDQSKLASLSITAKNESVESVLVKLLAKTECDYQIVENEIAIVPKKGVRTTAQDDKKSKIKIEGKVISSNTKKPVTGATVIITGTTKGAITDDKGQFLLETEEGATMTVSFMGMVEVTHIVAPADTKLTIEMVEDVVSVEDVVVTGYFNRNKSSYTGNATSYTGKELTQMSSSNVLSTLSMIDPSFKMVINNDFGNDPNRMPEFQIQGSTNIKNEYSNSPNMPTFILDGFEVTAEKVFDLDPNRVKSMTILKDASATAIYGSRAANGVVVIETIVPQSGKVRVSYTFNGDFDIADLSSYDLMNAREKLAYEVEAKLFKHSYPVQQESLDVLYNQKLKFVKQGIDTDWIKKPVDAVGFSHKHSVLVEGGDDSFRYAVDLNYRGTNGVMKKSGRDNYGIGIKLQYNYKNIKFANDLTVDNTKSYNSPYGEFSEYSRMNPYYHPYDENGNTIFQLFKAPDFSNSRENVYNPLYNATIGTKDENSLLGFSERFTFEWDFAKDFKFRAKASLDRENYKSDIFKPNGHTSFAEVTEYKGQYDKEDIVSNTYNINLMASYIKNINKHNINAVVIYDVRETKSDTYSFSAYNFPNDKFDHVSMATKYKEGDSPSGNDEISRLMGVAFNANYGYDDRYLADFSVRSDASSMFGANKRWGTFYSVGLGWNLNKEKFLKDNSTINNLKIRGSFGTTGGQNFNPYQAMMMYSYKDQMIDGTIYGDEMGALVMAYGNPDLKWQVTQKLNIGVDFSLLNNRLSGFVNYYENITKDKLIDFTLAPSTGFINYTENLGNVENKGWEVNLKGTIIRNIKSDFRWDVFVNLVTNNNKLMNINDALTAYNNKQNDFIDDNFDSNLSNKPVVKYMEGQSINTIWANRSLGIDPATGDEVFLDLNGNRTNVYDVRNDLPIAITDPDFEGNFGTSLAYKGFNLNLYFAYSIGGYVYNTTLVDKVENVNPLYNGDKRILYDRWTKVGDEAKFKRITDTGITHPTSRFIEKENFFRLSSVNISYQFRMDKLRKAGIEMLKIAAIGNDIFRASTVKQERGVEYPFARKFTINVQLTF